MLITDKHMALPERFHIDTSTLTHSCEIQDFFLAYKTYGKLNEEKTNAILFPTYYTGTHTDNEKLIGPGRALDSDAYFIVVPNLIGNGQSSSPSNTPGLHGGAAFPEFTIHQNILAQEQLLQHLGVSSIRLALGWSMGGLQTYHWCVHQPTFIKNALVICATAKTSEHNYVFLEGVKAALKADPAFNNGHYQSPPAAGLGAFGRVYAGWAYSQAFFRNRRYKDLGFDNTDAFLNDWEQDHLKHDANDLLVALSTWQQADIGQHPRFNGDTIAALQSIQSKIWLMPCEQDLYFRHEDNRAELPYLQQGYYCGYESDFGHCSAGPGRFQAETGLIEDRIRSILLQSG